MCGPAQHEGGIVNSYVAWLKECHMSSHLLKYVFLGLQ